MTQGAPEPLVSVVLPTHNRASTLGPAIRSVLEQTYTNLELLVVDDGSTDGSGDIARALADERTSVISRPTSIGAAAARNEGLATAKGTYIAFQDSDDQWHPGLLRCLVGILERSGDVVVAYSSMVMPGEGRIPGPCDPVREGDLSAVLPRYNLIGLPAAVVRSAAFRSVGGFDARLGRNEDWDLFLGLSRLGEFRFHSEPLLDVGEGSDRISSREDAHYRSLELILAKHRSLFNQDPRVLAAHELQLLGWAVRSGHPRNAAAALVGLLRRPGAATRAVASRLQGRSLVARSRCV